MNNTSDRQRRVCLEAPHLLKPSLPGAASVPGGRTEAGTQWAEAGSHQPGPAGTGKTAGAPDQWKCPALLCPLLIRVPEGPRPHKRKASHCPGPHGMAAFCCLSPPSQA